MSGMKTRLIKPEFFKNEELGNVNFAAKLLFAGLWCASDRDGRLRDRPLVIAGDVFPTHVNVTANDVNGWLDELAAIHVIERYEVDGKRYIQVCNFAKHQRIHPKESSSEFPPPPPVRTLAEPDDVQGSEKVRPFPGIPKPECVTSTSTITSTISLSSRESRHRANDARRRRAGSTARSLNGFDRFWSAYPNRTHRLDAEKAWRTLDPPPDLVAQIVAAIEVWKGHRQWADRQFIPYPATWLRRRLWEDEFVSTAGQAAQAATSDTLASLRRQYEHLTRRAQGGDPQAVLTLAEFERDQGPKLGIQRDHAPPAVEPVQEVAP